MAMAGQESDIICLGFLVISRVSFVPPSFFRSRRLLTSRLLVARPVRARRATRRCTSFPSILSIPNRCSPSLSFRLSFQSGVIPFTKVFDDFCLGVADHASNLFTVVDVPPGKAEFKVKEYVNFFAGQDLCKMVILGGPNDGTYEPVLASAGEKVFVVRPSSLLPLLVVVVVAVAGLTPLCRSYLLLDSSRLTSEPRLKVWITLFGHSRIGVSLRSSSRLFL